MSAVVRTRLLLVSALAAVCAWLVVPGSAGAYVYWANGGCCVAGTPSIGTIARANNDGTHANESFINPPGNSTNLQGLSVGSSDIFWVDAQNGTVGHANIDGSNPNNRFILDSRSTAGVASDSTYVFWSNAATHLISRANLNGSSPGTFLSPGGSIVGLADVGGTLYWVNASNHTIGYSSTSAASNSTLLTVPTPAGGSTPALAYVAVGGGYVYWSDTANNTIGRASLASPSTTANDSFITGASGPEGVAVDSNYIYWSNSGETAGTHPNTVGRANLDGSGVDQTFITGASVPYGLQVDSGGVTSLSASAPSSATAGSGISASSVSASLSGGASPSGMVTFKVFGPQSSAPSSCSGGTTVGTATVSGDGTYRPGAGFTPSQPGDYWWYASYSGDSNNGSAASTCGSGMAETVVAQAAPVNAGAPSISGSAEQGQTLTESHGQWSNGPVSYGYQWEDCDSAGANCVAITGATGQSYTLSGSDVGHTVRVLESASNSGGSAQSTSAQTGVVSAPAPGDLQISTSGPVSRSGSTVDPGIQLTCPVGGSSCSAGEQATVVIGGRSTPINSGRHGMQQTMSVGSAQFTIPAAGSSATGSGAQAGTVEAIFHLNTLGMNLLADHKHLQVQLKISGQAQGQQPVSATKTITLTGQFAHYNVSSVRADRDGTVTVHVRVSAPGQINVLVSAWKDNIAGAARALSPATRRFVVGRVSATVKKAGLLTLHVHPTAQGRRLIAHPAYRATFRVWVSYIPLYGFQIDDGWYGLHPGHNCSPCHVHRWP